MKHLSIVILILLVLCIGGVNAAAGSGNGDDKEEKVSLPYVSFPPEVYQLLKSSQWEQAVEKLTRLYEAPGSDTNLKYYIAYCYEHIADIAIKEKRYRDAIDRLNDALDYVDDQPRIYFGQGACYFSLAQYDEAEEAFSTVVRMQPDHFLAHRMLGEINYFNNNLDAAREHWETALKLKPDDSYTKKRLAGLKKFDKVAENFETEVGMMFSVSFDGKEKPELRELVLGMLEKISSEIGQELGIYPRRQIPVILLTNRAFFDITGSPEWAGGVYEGQIKVPVDKYDAALLRIVLAHEYVHAVIFDRLSFRCPWWLNEGLAQYLSFDRVGNKKKLDLAAKYIGEGEVPSLGELPGDMLKGGGARVKVAYALALSAVRYFVDEFGMSDLQLSIDLMAEGKGFAGVIGDITGYSFKEFQASWKEAASGK
jgi:tetratricopeptide (TPR) repeat protein